MIGRAINDLLTPSLILDRAKLLENIERMERRVKELQIELRPHMKTSKSVDVLDCLPSGRGSKITVSTLREASYFLAAGVTDIFYAVPLAPDKVPIVRDLLGRGADLKVLVDSAEAAACLAAAGRAQDVMVPVMLEIDVDNYRSGIAVDDAGFLQAARILSDGGGTRFAGIMTYAGASYGCGSPDQVAELCERHRRAANLGTARLAEAGIDCPIVSFGSTPATMHARSLGGFTETRCGIYMFQDLFQAGIGACEIENIAVSVLVSVIAKQGRLNRFFIDAGGLALSKDRSTQGKSFDAGFGLVCDADSGTPIPDLFVAAVSQELGLVTTRTGSPINLDEYPIGRKLRILPNHADMTVAAYDSYQVVDGSERVIAEWPRANGWHAAIGER